MSCGEKHLCVLPPVSHAFRYGWEDGKWHAADTQTPYLPRVSTAVIALKSLKLKTCKRDGEICNWS